MSEKYGTVTSQSLISFSQISMD